MRHLLQLSFNGSTFHGWQKQANAHSVQQEVETALATLLRQEIETTGCGRTDTGVHAKEFFLHFDYPQQLDSQLVYKLNKLLPASIAVQSIQTVSDFFHARFDAGHRVYRYFIHHSKDPFLEGLSWHYPFQTNFEAMNKAATLMLQHKNFQCFSKSNTQVHTYLCDVMEAGWLQQDDQWYFQVKANRFLRNMVRAVVGTLLEVGKGDMNQDGFAAVLDSGSRSQAGFSVPAHGLYLWHVDYDKATLDMNRKTNKIEQYEEED